MNHSERSAWFFVSLLMSQMACVRTPAQINEARLWRMAGYHSEDPKARFRSFCEAHRREGEICRVDDLVLPDRDRLRAELGVPKRNRCETFGPRMLPNTEARFALTHSLPGERHAWYSRLVYEATWPCWSGETRRTCAAVIDPKTGEIEDTMCTRTISGRPAESFAQRRTTPVSNGLARRWAALAAEEDEAVVAFGRHVRELHRLGAPKALLCRVRAALRDEVRHTQAALHQSALFQGGPVQLLGARHRLPPRDSVLVMALDLAGGGAIGETLNAALLLEEAALVDGPEALLLRSIAKDELRHAGLAWDTLFWWWPQFDSNTRRAVVDRLSLPVAGRSLLRTSKAAVERAERLADRSIRYLRMSLMISGGLC